MTETPSKKRTAFLILALVIESYVVSTVEYSEETVMNAILYVREIRVYVLAILIKLCMLL